MKKTTQPRRGCLPGVLLSLSLTGVPLHGQQVIIQTEQDDSIPTANATGFTAGSSGIRVAYGNTGDGLYASTDNGGDGTGDMDFYRIPASAGQVITAQLKNFGFSDNFDSVVGIYSYSGGAATLVAVNDDVTSGAIRASTLTYTAPAAGDYYICVSNWIDMDDPPDAAFPSQSSLPNNPLTPGTGNGPPGGTAGPYQLFIGLNHQGPIPQFDGGGKTNPTPPLNLTKLVGTTYTTGNLKISNTGNAAYTVSVFSINGPDAAKFNFYGLQAPFTIPAGGSRTVKVAVNMAGVTAPLNAVLDFTGNDVFDLSYALTAVPGPVIGKGTFAAKQISAASGTTVNSMSVADQLLDGTLTGTAYNAAAGVINFGTGVDGHVPGDANFPIGATPGDNFVLQVTGTFDIREAGEYTFLGYSDDGQRLRIDGEELYSFADYNVDHFAPVTLTAGPHMLEFTMFEGGGGNHAELQISKTKGNFPTYAASVWEPLEATGLDTDNDGIADYRETALGTDPKVADSGADPDNDGLGNLGELIAGTKTSVADTDGDGLLDGVETKTGSYADANSAGTDPLVADTDGDGLRDGIENPALPHTGAAQPGTDPNKKDTDGDGYADLTEPSFGTDPTVAASVPVFNFKTALSENFETPGFHSVYGFRNLNNSTAFSPGILEAADLPPTRAARLNETGVNSTHNALGFDYVDIPAANAVKLEFDFRLTALEGDTNPADGFGFGFFRKSVYSTTGVNPLLITNAKSWENPTGGGGYGDALFFGFTIYGTDVLRLTGPAAPASPLASVTPDFGLVTGRFHRAIITVLANGPDSSMVKLQIIEDVNGVAAPRMIMDNIRVPGFVIANEDFRFIAGGRTGGASVRTELDNMVYSFTAPATPALVLSNTSTTLLASIHDSATNVVNASSVTATLNGAPITVKATKAGAITTITHTTPAGTFYPGGSNTVVFNYNAGSPMTETRAFTPAHYMFPPAMAAPLNQGGTPGFSMTVNQVASISPAAQYNYLAHREGVFSALRLGYDGSPYVAGGNTASAGASGIVPVLNFEQDGAGIGLIQGDQTFPGIPGTTDTTDNFQTESLTWLAFPAPGLYNLGVTADDGVRLSATHAPVGTLSVASPASTARVLAFTPSVLGSAIGGIAGPNPLPPLVRKVVLAQPADATAALTNAAEIAGNIALIDRGANSFAAKILFAQQAGAAAVVIVNQNNPDALPIILGGDGTGITIPAGMISKGEGDLLKALITSNPAGVMLSYGEDTTTTILKDDRGRGWDTGEILGTVAVETPGLYPVRLFHFEGSGGANLELYSISPDGVRHLVNDSTDAESLKAYASLNDGTAPTISITRSGNTATIHYTGILESSNDLINWAIVNGATSPHTVTLSATGRLFFRTKQ